MAISFVWYQFVDTTYGLTHLPANTHLIHETSTALYYVSVDADDEIWKYTIATGTDAKLLDIGYSVFGFYPDRTNNRLYYGYLDTLAGEFVVRYIDLSNDSDNADFVSGLARTDILDADVYKYGANAYVIDIEKVADGGAWDVYIVERKSALTNSHLIEDDFAPANCDAEIGKAIIIGTFVWFIYQIPDAVGGGAGDGIRIYKKEPGNAAITEMHEEASGFRLPSTHNQRGIAYDGNDKMYFILEDTDDSKNYLCSYSIGTDTFTQLQEHNVALMMDRNCYGGDDPRPDQYEKAFHLTYSYIYEIAGDNLANQFDLLKLQDLGLASGKTIKVITDWYLIDSDKNVYKYINCMDKVLASGHEENLFSVPTASMIFSSELVADQIIEIYYYSTIRADYTLVLKSKLGIGELEGGKWNYNPVNLGAKDLMQKVSYTASATGIDEVVIALVGQLTNPYIWCDTDSVPNIAVNMTYVFDNSTLWDALYVCAILGNAYFWVEPNGYLHFRTYANKQPTGWYLGSGGLNYETVGTSSTSIAWVDSATLYDGACVIVESWQSHYNVLRLQDDATPAEDPIIWHYITQSLTGIFECYIGSNNTASEGRIHFSDTGTGVAIAVRFSNDDLEYIDNLGAWQKIDDVADNTLYHIKIQWYNDNTYDLYLDGTQILNGVGMFTGMGSGINRIYLKYFADSTDYLYLDAPGLVGEVDPRGVTYVAGYNDEDTLNQATNNISYPTSERMEAKFNIWDIDGGWNAATNAPFNKRETDEEHILQYGPNQWTGRDQFSGAHSQAALDAIAAGLKALQGMMTSPFNATFRLIGRWYYPIGKYMNFQFTPVTTFATAADMLISRASYNHKNPKEVTLTLTQNIVRMG